MGNDEVNTAATDKKKDKKLTRAERRKKRREDREKRRKNRAERRKARKESGGGGGANPFYVVFSATAKFFWAMLRPWVWPWWLSVPLMLVCAGVACFGCYSVYAEVGGSRRGRRVPEYNSWSYKVAN